MSTRHDRNFLSFDSPEQRDASDVVASPDWPEGSWQDTVKFHKRIDRRFERFHVVRGGTEDAVDVSPECVGNSFSVFLVASGGDYVLTLKGGSNHNDFSHWRITKPGRLVDIEVGNWSSSNFDNCVGNVFFGWTRDDGKPITYCYRWGCRPWFQDMTVKHLWWRSIGLTVYWWSKYVWHRVLKRPDK